ncbi:hypothetical protein KM043_017952 [Ampulex compressa]|nr:hypothetical protein KM043_017952 [Ampulex compressa]
MALMQKVTPYLNSQKRIYMPRGLTRGDFENSINYLRESVYPKNHHPDELDKLQQILSANRLSLLELFENISPNCSDQLVMCRVEKRIVPCEAVAHTIVTPYGMCCSFNYENPRESLRRLLQSLYCIHITLLHTRRRPNGTAVQRNSVVFGDHFILSIILKSVPSRNRISPILYGDGIKVMVHERYTHPTHASLGIVAAAGYETIIQLHGNRLTSSEEILNLPPDIRGCFTSSAKKHYRADNCHVRCRESVIQKLCGCLPFWVSSINNGEQVCDLSHVSCLARIALHIYSLTLQDSECNCPPNCEETTYRIGVTALPLSKTQHNHGEFYNKVYATTNATVLHFTYDSQSATLQRRELILTKMNLVSSLGGVFGLFLGCSFISVIEIFYFFCINVLKKYKQRIDNM